MDTLATIQSRWQRALELGTIKFDPNDPNQFKEQQIGRFIKRIIPDRLQSEHERMSDCTTPVSAPLTTKDFDYNRISPEQELTQFVSNQKITYKIVASNSPLAHSLHALIIPKERRPQFILTKDLEIVYELWHRNKQSSFMFSSMGAGAGVNHMHWHYIVGSENYPISSAERNILYQSKDITVCNFPDWPTNAYAFHGNTERIANIASKFIDVLQSNDVPHNLALINGDLLINPRARKIPSILKNKKFGTWETVLGIFNACSINEYEFINEKTFLAILEDIMLDSTDAKKYEIILRNFINE